MDFRIFFFEDRFVGPDLQISICQEGFELLVHLVGGDVASSSMESVELMISIPKKAVKQKHFVLTKAGTRKGGIMEISNLTTNNCVFIKVFSCTDCLSLRCAYIYLMLICMQILAIAQVVPLMKRMK